MRRTPVLVTLSFAAFAALAGCSVPDEPVEIHDPYEGANRKVHAFNKAIDRAALDPTATVYGTVIPRPLRSGFSKVANNLDTPRFVLNNILQGNVEDAGLNTFRFLLNSTVGIGGLFDFAESIGLERAPTGFGETLHVWGVEEGAYIELPVLGPSNERDAVGRMVDFVSNPLRAVVPDDEDWIFTAATITDGLNTRYRFDSTIASIYSSADSYAQARSLYLQNRRFELGEDEEDFLFDPYADFEE